MRVLMTGATGLLGQNLLFEIIKQHLGELDQLQVFVLGRAISEADLGRRLDQLFTASGYDYLGTRDQGLVEQLRQAIVPIPFDLDVDSAGLALDRFTQLRRSPIDLAVHVASLTDFRSDPATQARLENTNIEGVKRLLSLLDTLEIGQLAYVSSAYVCGAKVGPISPDYLNPHETFRNAYERSKMEAELLWRQYAGQRGIKYRIFRPSTIGGRLLENPIGHTPKFDVFYQWAAFWLLQKLRQLPSPRGLYEEEVNMEVRIHVNPRSGLNIVPADYAARVLYTICRSDMMGQSYHIASPAETPHTAYIRWMLEAINVTGYSFVEEDPADKNKLEKLYYRSMGKVFTPYITCAPMEFDISNLRTVENRIGLSCPILDRQAFMKLMGFAKEHRFGLEVPQESATVRTAA